VVTEPHRDPRWDEGSLADEVSRLVFGVERYNRDLVRKFCDRIQALEDELVDLKKQGRKEPQA
jgi:hypothetical protein